MASRFFEDLVLGVGPPSYSVRVPLDETVVRAPGRADTFLVLTAVAADGSRRVTFRKYQDGDVIQISADTTVQTWSPDP